MTRPTTSNGVALYSEMRFRYPWRPYQARILSSLEQHLNDRRLHIVAPPGSGKTILGLEVVRRLGRPALVLAPTLTIREQWVSRANSDFEGLVDGPLPVSRALDSPALLTVVTYQAVHLACGDEAVAAALREAGVETLVVDEAHHLRREWWKSLEWLSSKLEETIRVSLTATPPYDVSQQEWNRYLGFCGPIDEEIGVPELVGQDNLCAHQDYVYLGTPTGDEAQRLEEWRRQTRSLVNDLALDLELATVVGEAPAVVNPADHRAEVFEHVELYLAVAIFLGNLRWEAAAPLCTVLEIDGVALPELDLGWSELLLGGILDGPLELPKEVCRRWRRRLEGLDALSGKRVELRSSKRRAKLLIDSVEKRRSIRRIVEHEHTECGESLRLVILADHIREAALRGEIEKIGVVPIFQDLRKLCLPELPIGVLTGRLVIVPKACVESLRIRFESGTMKALDIDPSYVELRPAADERHRIVAAVGELFSRGEIRALVGTAALLGEGWDLPAVNTLVLATAIGSFVTSNQMRGRALRTDDRVPDKVANIWHVATVDPGSHANEDLERLRRRFDAFLGVSSDSDEISSGLDRLGELQGNGSDGIDGWNQSMIVRSADRREMIEKWRRSIGGDGIDRDRLIRELSVPASMLSAKLVVADGGRATGVLANLRRWWIGRRLLRMAEAVAMALVEQKMIPPLETRCHVRSPAAGWAVSLPGARQQVQWRFVSCLSEVFDILSSPRYLLRHRGSRYWAVPEVFGKNIERAKPFSKTWRRYFGRHQLIFTGTNEGRAHLAVAKSRALLEHFQLRTETRARWG